MVIGILTVARYIVLPLEYGIAMIGAGYVLSTVYYILDLRRVPRIRLADKQPIGFNVVSELIQSSLKAYGLLSEGGEQ